MFIKLSAQNSSTRYRRRWNNILIFFVVTFVLVLGAPNIIKTYLIKDNHAPLYFNLFDPNSKIQALHFENWSLEKKQGSWRVNKPSHIAAEELAQRWHSLIGTEVDKSIHNQLRRSLNFPQVVKVWYFGLDKPQEIFMYQTNQFWILKNWQNKWIAISADKDYLIPKF
ncbi:hypothetical protein CF67_18015 [Candidatus Photodesmus blepharus]|uniref:50S ribosomal protein L33 n=1 Tax=Candidatus Photodesmus blepharonis TaxID=1179155 RepID=A0A084CNL8_9GAMM|nr:hypothetical protein [Candidatus Photodesmus blepharus]KEY91397.1 hypothetical protein CF67_18015 [Candidatus Photodesmus blepharus]